MRHTAPSHVQRCSNSVSTPESVGHLAPGYALPPASHPEMLPTMNVNLISIQSVGKVIPPPSSIRGFRCITLFYSVPIRTILRAAAFNRRCRHPFLSVPPRAATDAATHFHRCRRVLLLMPPPMFIGAAGSFPFPREKGSEKGSQTTCEGCAGKPDFSQKSGFKSGCLWLRLAQDNILVKGRLGVRFTRGFSKFKSHWLNDPSPLFCASS